MDDERSELSGLQMGAMGAAAASPFAGLIGEKPIIHDPLQGAEGQQFKRMRDVSRAAQPGDVLLTSKSKGSLFKNFITPAGQSQFYHAQPVTGRQDGVGYTMSAGDLYDQGISPSKAKNFDTPIHDYMKNDATSYSDAVLLRPKTPLTKEQLKALQTSYGQRVVRPYDNTKALSTFARDLFVPKLDALTKGRAETVCEGNVCSTMPAMAYNEATGKRVIPGKASQDVFPTDFLRSDQFKLVGSHVTPETAALERSALRKASPWLLRGGIGAGLAGGTYAASEDPALVAGGAGAYGANKAIDAAFTNEIPEAARKLLPVSAYEQFPTLWEAGDAAMTGGLRNPETREILKRFSTRRLPVLAAGGALAYGGAKALQNAFSE